jgi:hypothetical protein
MPLSDNLNPVAGSLGQRSESTHGRGLSVPDLDLCTAWLPNFATLHRYIINLAIVYEYFGFLQTILNSLEAIIQVPLAPIGWIQCYFHVQSTFKAFVPPVHFDQCRYEFLVLSTFRANDRAALELSVH